MVTPAPSVRAGAGMRMSRAAVFTAVCVVLAAAGHTMASGRTVPGWSLLFGWLAVFAVVAPLAGRERTLPGIAALLALGQLALHAVFNVGQMCATISGTAAGAGSGSPAGAGAGPLAAPGSGDGGLMAVAARLVCDNHGLRLTPAAARQVVVGAGLDPATLGSRLHMPGMRMPGMDMPGVRAASGAAGSEHAATAVTRSMTSMTSMLSMCSLPMLLGHLLAAVVAGWLLRRGEAALWRLIRLSARGVASLSALSPAVLRRAWALLSALAARVPYAGPRARRVARGPGARHRTVWLRHCLAGRAPPVVVLAA
ncbi:hypothetical protein GA0115240_17175 [Streptomyces sp. DvalAA-14]|uniref:hypothetical protein n=1 Tax=unclassified Streptomyces TaxID=2593676 RepID=UPI00081B7325|nr:MULTISPECIES: hypothetical protein [unclassified Streptomyces]MYS24939.1 hypothetical protein [Streptomyces sp. SID4948]SCE50723.1 hypothetical protein GA0115240_17175 [Streptomyces sp. DvalAA-14]